MKFKNILLIFIIFLLKEYKLHKTHVPSGCVRVYEQCHFWGWSKVFCGEIGFVGDHYNDCISSFILGPHSEVVFFEHAHFRGWHKHYERNISCLVHEHFNDKISSIAAYDYENYENYEYH